MPTRASIALVGTLGAILPGLAGAAPTDYNRDVRPILSDRCFKCHGPDARERRAGLRLDSRAEALRPAKSGHVAIVPGQPDASSLVRRIRSTDPDEVMPPPSSQKSLGAAEKSLLERWVAEGAPYQEHWAFVRPARPAPPSTRAAAWPRGDIDRFILARLEAEGLLPAPEADPATLLRRVTLDLTGLPPAPAEVDAFLADRAPGAYERAVDRLLESPHHGERLALDWLDAARFADTNGYHIDNGRDMTAWRDWVIRAFNENLPFDRFTIEQLAGDLLPGATIEQQVASGFHRNHMINFEGGAIPEEYHAAYLVDRVNTTGTIWLGMTVACAQCHDHKYDPITQREFYQLYAFFNNVPENGLDGNRGNAAPLLALPTAAQRAELERLDAGVRAAEEAVKKQPAGDHREAEGRLERARKERQAAEQRIPTTMVMREMEKPRDTFLLVRGQYDRRGERVQAGVPAFLPGLPPDGRPDRLGLARWLTRLEHPLVARVIANRYWQMLFGTGLVKTAEDFGSQGELPSHPELLDWLATGFSQDWDVRALLRRIVTSATYRQSSVVTAALRERDPENRLLARGPRLRLPAEHIRDQALAASGLLDRRIGGRSVSPYQPPGLWEELASREDGANWTAQTYTQSHGADLYRRGMYTFWKRTSPPPTLITFDAPDRETCTVRRPRTNTPLQALILMNDPTYVEAARKLAERLLREAGSAPGERIALAFRLVLGRRPAAREVDLLEALQREQLDVFRGEPDRARRLLEVGEAPRDESLDALELASWALVTSAILNLDEAVTRG